jgi:DNA-directed RNA polymerase I, II, and III subunit RPABC2
MQDGEQEVNGVTGEEAVASHADEWPTGNAAGILDTSQPAPAVEDTQDVPTAGGLVGERQPNAVRVTTPYLTKYERARILGTRALQIRCSFNSSALFAPKIINSD